MGILTSSTRSTSGQSVEERDRRRRFWPDGDEELLLVAALADGEEAAGALEVWQRRVDINLITSGAHRLLPLLYRNAIRLDLPLQDAGIVTGVYRRSWYRNSVLLAGATNALATLGENQIETLLLDATLNILYYPDHGARPMNNIDVLVPPEKVQRAIETLEGHGWEHNCAPLQRQRSWSRTLTHSDGGALDLHWYPRFDLMFPGSAEPLWQAAVPTHPVAPTSALSPSDLLLHVLGRGMAPGGELMWVADALTVMRKAPDLDWDRLEVESGRQYITVRALTGLKYLAERFAAPVPSSLINALQARPTPRWERTEAWANERFVPSERWLRTRQWFQYKRLRLAEKRRAHPAGFVRYLAVIHDTTVGSVVGAGGRRVVNYLLRHPTGPARLRSPRNTRQSIDAGD